MKIELLVLFQTELIKNYLRSSMLQQWLLNLPQTLVHIVLI